MGPALTEADTPTPLRRNALLQLRDVSGQALGLIRLTHLNTDSALKVVPDVPDIYPGPQRACSILWAVYFQLATMRLMWSLPLLELRLNERELLQALRHVVSNLSGLSTIGRDGPEATVPPMIHEGIEDAGAIWGPADGASGLVGVKTPVDSISLGELYGLSGAVGPYLYDVEAPVPVGHVGYPLAIGGEAGVVLVVVPLGKEGSLTRLYIDDPHLAPS